MVTAYDYPGARVACAAGADLLLVGDSLGMVVLGYDSTTQVTMDEMLHHCKAVARARASCMVVGDMPFGSYLSEHDALSNGARLLKEGGVDALKLEGGARVAPLVRALTNAGMPVMGHVGLTPQSATALGGCVVQGATAAGAAGLLEDALALQDAGCFAVVLELVPEQVARLITEQLDVPSIGIGAGAHTSGQVLVYHDLLGLYEHAQQPPRFVKEYASLGADSRCAVAAYVEDVRTRSFPQKQHAFKVKRTELDAFRRHVAAQQPPLASGTAPHTVEGAQARGARQPRGCAEEEKSASQVGAAPQALDGGGHREDDFGAVAAKRDQRCLEAMHAAMTSGAASTNYAACEVGAGGVPSPVVAAVAAAASSVAFEEVQMCKEEQAKLWIELGAELSPGHHGGGGLQSFARKRRKVAAMNGGVSAGGGYGGYGCAPVRGLSSKASSRDEQGDQDSLKDQDAVRELRQAPSHPRAPKPLRVLVIGGGAMGSLFAARLTQAAAAAACGPPLAGSATGQDLQPEHGRNDDAAPAVLMLTSWTDQANALRQAPLRVVQSANVANGTMHDASHTQSVRVRAAVMQGDLYDECHSSWRPPCHPEVGLDGHRGGLHSDEVAALATAGHEERSALRQQAGPQHAAGGQFDVAIVLVKDVGANTERAARVAKRLLKPDGTALSLQNGVGATATLHRVLCEENDRCDPSAEAGGGMTVLGGVTSHGARILRAGVVEHAGAGLTYVAPYTEGSEQPQPSRSSYGGETLSERHAVRALRDAASRCEEVAALLCGAGFETETLPAHELPRATWSKLALNAAINPLTALARVPNGALLQNASLLATARALALEVEHVARAHGVALLYDDVAEQVERVAAATAPNTSSMLADVLRADYAQAAAMASVALGAESLAGSELRQAPQSPLEACGGGRLTEVRAINGHVVAQGAALGVPTPLNALMLALLSPTHAMHGVTAQPSDLHGRAAAAAADIDDDDDDDTGAAQATLGRRPMRVVHTLAEWAAVREQLGEASSCDAGSHGQPCSAGAAEKAGFGERASQAADVTAARRRAEAGQVVGFVPTMGGLHEGHLSLVREARARCDAVVVSIFVNPTQFAAHEDLTAYPRTLEEDLRLLRLEGVDAVLVPSVEDVYPRAPELHGEEAHSSHGATKPCGAHRPELRAGCAAGGSGGLGAVFVDVENVDAATREGRARPGFFRGVATVLTKLFHVVRPHAVFMGQKDGTQAQLVQRIAQQLHLAPWRMEVVVVPTARAHDGLALSSRNVYLSPPQRAAAPAVYGALLAARARHAQHAERSPSVLEAVAREAVQQHPDAEQGELHFEYLSVSCASSGRELQDADAAAVGKGGVMLSIAVRAGSTRLIDNIVIEDFYR